MSSLSADWNVLLWRLMYSLPNLIAWCIAIYFCTTRRRENPKGAVYLGLAVMVSLVSTVVGYGWTYLLNWTGVSGIFSGIQFFIAGFHACTTLAFWVFIIMAVFARPTHYDYLGGSVFNDAE
ncbi:MAG: hypothetical protein P8M30_00990 [Planctomycetaceae bacterium]|jgi:hypothetical protein|nr:hypothetical protein [Planctomycetaceae bacterium]